LPLLTRLLNKYINKKIEYNIINIKSLVYSPDIFTDFISLKIAKLNKTRSGFGVINRNLAQLYTKILKLDSKKKVFLAMKNFDTDKKYIFYKRYINSNLICLLKKRNLNNLLKYIFPSFSPSLKSIKSTEEAKAEQPSNIFKIQRRIFKYFEHRRRTLRRSPVLFKRLGYKKRKRFLRFKVSHIAKKYMLSHRMLNISSSNSSIIPLFSCTTLLSGPLIGQGRKSINYENCLDGRSGLTRTSSVDPLLFQLRGQKLLSGPLSLGTRQNRTRPQIRSLNLRNLKRIRNQLIVDKIPLETIPNKITKISKELQENYLRLINNIPKPFYKASNDLTTKVREFKAKKKELISFFRFKRGRLINSLSKKRQTRNIELDKLTSYVNRELCRINVSQYPIMGEKEYYKTLRRYKFRNEMISLKSDYENQIL
jgi:hypothetical protein